MESAVFALRGKFPVYGIVGLCIILTAEILLFLKVYIIGVYFTPIVWTGYIFFVDALNYRLSSNSLIMTRRKEFLVMLPWSIACWYIFEGYNLYLQNWTYVGLPENFILRLIGYFWSYATIFPAILETAELIGGILLLENRKPLRFSSSILMLFFVFGFLCLMTPLIVSQSYASKLFALVWVGFVFLLEPVNYWLGGMSILREFERGSFTLFVALLLAGVVCGVLWEFWNYWAIAKWQYSIPISFVGPKVFEMPLLGYLGFLPFAVECFAMQKFFVALFPAITR